jgi:hypothetical protein
VRKAEHFRFVSHTYSRDVIIIIIAAHLVITRATFEDMANQLGMVTEDHRLVLSLALFTGLQWLG